MDLCFADLVRSLTFPDPAEVISKKQKIRFLLGIFDGNDNRLFDQGKFMRMMKAVDHGIAAMFRSSNLKGSPEGADATNATMVTMPRPQVMEDMEDWEIWEQCIRFSKFQSSVPSGKQLQKGIHKEY